MSRTHDHDPLVIGIEEALNRLRDGQMLILTDDQHREDEADLVMAAEKITPETMNFMIQHGSGIVCLPMAGVMLDRLQVPMMVSDNDARFDTPFTVSIEAREGVSTGVSAADRARTVAAAVASDATPSDICMPGHVFPLRAKAGGVIERQGHTEGSVDLMRLAGLKPAAVICEVMNADGDMCRGPALLSFARQYQLPIVRMQDLIRYRYSHESIVQMVSTAKMPVDDLGEFTVKVFKNRFDHSEQVVLMRGEVNTQEPALVRLHSECLTGDVLRSKRCDCGEQLQQSLARIGKEGGVLIYLRQEGRGIGLVNKIRAYALQDEGMDTVEANHHLGFEADQREYHMAAQILQKLGVQKIKLLTNNPAKLSALQAYGLEVVGRECLEIQPSRENIRYLRTKRDKLGHMISQIGHEECQ